MMGLQREYDVGVSENRLNPLYPMVLLIIIPFFNGYFIGKINPTFSDKPMWQSWDLEKHGFIYLVCMINMSY